MASLLLQWVDIGEDEDLTDPTAAQRQYYYTRVPAKAAAEMYRLLRAAYKVAPLIDVPVLILQSPHDAGLHPEGAEALLRQLATVDKRLIWLDRSGHNALVDAERGTVLNEIYRFIEGVAQHEGAS